MPKAKITGATITYTYDDDSESEIEIDSGVFDDSGPYVSVKSDSDTFYFNPETWPLIKEQVDGFMNKLIAEQD